MDKEMGIRRLWRHVIYQVLLDCLLTEKSDFAKAASARTYLAFDEDFDYIAELADLDPIKIKKSILIARDKKRESTLRQLLLVENGWWGDRRVCDG